MVETRMFFWILDAETLGHRRFWGLSDMHDAGLIRQHGEGWVPVSHTLTMREDGSALLAVMMNKEVHFETPE